MNKRPIHRRGVAASALHKPSEEPSKPVSQTTEPRTCTEPEGETRRRKLLEKIKSLPRPEQAPVPQEPRVTETILQVEDDQQADERRKRLRAKLKKEKKQPAVVADMSNFDPAGTSSQYKPQEIAPKEQAPVVVASLNPPPQEPSDSSSEDEDPLPRPQFIKLSTDASQAMAAASAGHSTVKSASSHEHSVLMLDRAIKEENARQAILSAQSIDNKSWLPDNAPDDRDGLDEVAEHQAWKERETRRLFFEYKQWIEYLSRAS